MIGDWRKDRAELRGVLFDLDGTILDSMPWHIRAWQDILTQKGVAIEDEFLYLNEGAIEATHLLEAIADHGLTPDREMLEDLLRLQASLFNSKFAMNVAPFPDALATLDRLSEAGLGLALITSSSRHVVERVLGPEMKSRFSVIVTGDEVGRGKPHPEPYLTGLKKMGLDSGSAMAVENAPAGISSAKAAGLACAALTTTLAREHLLQADFVFGSLSDLADHVLQPAG